MGLNCMGPLKCGYFSVVITRVLHNLQLVESTDVEELWVWRAGYKLHADQPLPYSTANCSFFFFQIILNKIFSKFKF